ncbi:glycosyltransferase family 39 protein, partial [bacterium]|nr:glycosyltransferase family 39 protein [bacterium]
MLHLFKRRTTLLFIVIIIVVSRFYILSSDPSFDFDLGYIADEGWWSHNARNYALFGNSILDEFNQQIIISYPFYVAQKLIFQIFGVGFYQARLVSAIAGLLAILIFFLHIKREKDTDTAALSSLFFGLNYIFLIYCRLALVDVMQLLFLLLSLYFISMKKQVFWGYFLSGLFFALALITKTTVIFAAGTFGFLLLYEILDKKGEWKKIIGRFFLFIISLTILLSCWYLFIVKPRGDEIYILYSRLAYDNFHGNYITAFKNIFTLFASITTNGINISQFITRMPVEQILFWLYLIHLLRCFLTKKGTSPLKRIDKLDLIFLSIIFFGFFTLSPMTHKPLRRYVVFIPFICYFAARIILNV